MHSHRFLLVAFVMVPAVAAAQAKLPPPASTTVDYLKDVRPLLSQNCYACHGPDVQQSGLRLDLRQNALRGGDYGPVILAGHSADSKLIRRLVDGDGGLTMPPTGALTDEEIGILRAWIDQGAEFVTEVATQAAPAVANPKLDALIAAVRSGDGRLVSKMLTEAPELVTAQDLAGSTALHHAAGFGPLATLTLLLDRGADPNARNRRASTPLLWAIHDEAKVRLLLSRGAAVDAAQIEGRTALYQSAVLGGGGAVLRMLLDAGAKPNRATLVGQTPLMAAASRGDRAAIALLIAKGADVNATNGAGETALMSAATNGEPRAVALLLEQGADATARSKRNETALGNAATSGNEETVKLLLDQGADVNVRNVRGYSPLMLAAGSDAIPVGTVKLLLAHGADVSYSADYDENARILASRRGDTEVARLLGGPGTVNAPTVTPIAAHERTREGTVSNAIERATTLLEKQSYNFIRIGGCNSCHSQDLTSAATAFARDKGVRVPREIPQLPASMLPSPERIMDLNVIAVAGPAWELFDLGMNHVPRNSYTDSVVRYLKAMQTPEGNWVTTEGRRPPMNSGDAQAVALSIYALKHYATAADQASTDKAIEKAVTFLKQMTPITTQDRAFHLLGLAWAGVNVSPLVDDATRALVAMQRSDGGWSQLPDMPSDAYATGEVLYALNTAGGLAVTNPLYQRGVDYLMRSQAADGSWHVASRSIWLQPYFESGFPYGRDQFISTAGTAWATMALVPMAEYQNRTSKAQH